jgi:two-component system sensor histidine kinase KdpD
LIIRQTSTPEIPLGVDQTKYHPDNPAKITTGDGGKTPSTRIYEDKHGLPVMFDEVVREPKKQTRAETNTISVLWHELISPLTLIKGYTATLLQLNDAISEEQKEQYLRGIDTASNRVIRLLENLRDITRLEETDAINLTRISLPDLLRQVASEMQNQTTKHVIKIRPGVRLPLVKADPEKIELVINNLLVNAIKYSPQGGDIEVETRMIQTEQELQRMFGGAPSVRLPCLVLSIADTGIGIPDGELDRIFEKFYRVKNKLTQTTPGAGLGLHICKIIVKAHNGHIWARNRMQGGSVFHFSLPLE